MVLFRSATKQVARRHGYHATFMCRPKLANVMSSGWHLHQSLTDRKSHANAFMDGREALSAMGRQYMAGLAGPCARGGRLQHADLQRLQALPPLLAGARPRDLGARQPRRHGARAGRAGRSRDAPRKPDRRAGGQSLSLLGQPDRERAGRARPHARSRPSADTPYEAEAPPLPRSLGEALAALGDDKALRAGFGDFFVDYYLKLKQAEIDRFNLEVSDWEQREYFSLF